MSTLHNSLQTKGECVLIIVTDCYKNHNSYTNLLLIENKSKESNCLYEEKVFPKPNVYDINNLL